MDIEFWDEELAKYYQGEKVRRKDLKSNKNLQKLFIKTINRLKTLDNMEEAYQHKALNYEKLTGDLTGKSSVRVDIKYRIIFQEKEDKQESITILQIEELSNHYQ